MRAVALVSLCGLFALSPAFAAQKGGRKSPEKPVEKPAQVDTDAAFTEAERLYNVGKYVEAAHLLETVYQQEPNPKLLYNIARAYDQAGELETSLDYYQRYVSSKDSSDPTLLKRAVLSIDRLRALLTKSAEQEEARRKAEEDARKAQSRAKAEAEKHRKEMDEARAREEAEARRQQAAASRNRVLAVTLGGVGVAALGTGTFFGLQARGSKGQFDSAATLADKQRLEAQTKSQALIADLGFGVGLAALVSAILLYPKGEEGDSAADESEEESLRLMVGPTSAGVQVRF